MIYKLNTIPRYANAPVVVHVNENDCGGSWEFDVSDGDKPFDESDYTYYPLLVDINIYKADKNIYSARVPDGISDGKVVVPIEPQMTACPGMAAAELVISEDRPDDPSYVGTRKATANFWLDVERSPLGMGGTPSESVLNYVELSRQATEAATTAAIEATEAAEEAMEAISHVEPLIQTDVVIDALLGCFRHVAWLDASGDGCYGALENALALYRGGADYQDIITLTGSLLYLGNIAHGAWVHDWSDAIGIYSERMGRSPLNVDHEQTYLPGYSFSTENGRVIISGEYVGTPSTSPANIGAYIYEGSLKATQGSGTFDPLIKMDGKDYYVTVYARNLKPSQNLDIRFRTLGDSGERKYNDTSITQDNPYFKHKFTAAQISAYGGPLGIGIYYYFGSDQTFDDVEIYVTVSSSYYQSEYVEPIPDGSTQVLQPRANCRLVSDDDVTIKIRGGNS